MSSEQSNYPEGKIRAENIGGIQETDVAFSPGVTILVGRNTTNRTSFLQAVMAALGGNNVAVKGDADEASVELTLGDETYTRQFHRKAGSIVSSGDPYLDEPELAELFAFLLESNEARQAVARGDNLRDLIMRPVDTEAIQNEIETLVRERDSLEDELDKIDEQKGTLPKLEEERVQLKEKIEEKKAELAETEEKLESADANVEETRKDKSELEEKLEKLRSKRSKLDDVRYDLETERESLESIKQERAELESERQELTDTPVGEIDEIESRISSLRQQKQRLEANVTELQSVIGFNEEMLDESDSDVLEMLNRNSSDTVTDQLVEDSEVTCWTCGSEVKQEQIESTVTQLQELSRSKVSEMKDLESEIAELQSKKRSLEDSQRERERITRQLNELEREIEESEETIDQLQTQRADITQEIEDLETKVNELEDRDYSAVLELHKEANQLEYELGRLENDLERIADNIETIEGRINEKDEIEAQLEAVKSELEDQRTKIERLEETAIEQFNDHMETVLDLLNYTNLERIWLERVEREVHDGRRKVTKSIFEMHVIRSADSGVAYEDTIDHLSESEREVTGLVFALSGYLAHELYNTVPFILLDSLEAIDSERIAALVDYLREYTGFLFAALLPEDASALPEGYDYVDEI